MPSKFRSAYFAALCRESSWKEQEDIYELAFSGKDIIINHKREIASSSHDSRLGSSHY